MNSTFTWTFRRSPHNKISLIVLEIWSLKYAQFKDKKLHEIYLNGEQSVATVLGYS